MINIENLDSATFFHQAVAIDEETGAFKSIWTPESTEDVEVLLRNLMDDDAEIIALKAKLSAITNNIKAEIARIEGRRRAYEYLYEPSILKIIDAYGGNDRWGRAIKTPYGTVRQVATKGSFAIANKEFAVQKLSEVQPQAIVNEPKIMFSLFDEQWRAEIMASKPDAVLNEYGLSITPPGVKISFTSGVLSAKED